MLHETIGMMDVHITHDISRRSDVKRYERLKRIHEELSVEKTPDGLVTREREVRQ